MEENNPQIKVSIKFDMDHWQQVYETIRWNVDKEMGRSRLSLFFEKSSFIIYIEAPDIGAIRATLGSITKWINIAERIFEEV